MPKAPSVTEAAAGSTAAAAHLGPQMLGVAWLKKKTPGPEGSGLGLPSSIAGFPIKYRDKGACRVLPQLQLKS